MFVGDSKISRQFRRTALTSIEQEFDVDSRKNHLSPGFAIPSVITTALETLNKASGREVDRSVSGFCLATCSVYIHTSESLQ